jgi:Holliday junction resolvase-like predicted endonuclease
MQNDILKITSYQVGIAAEAFAAGLFARLGYDVSIQYGANQPEYDLMVAKGDEILKVSVKGSQDGSWGLTQGHLTKGKANYKEAADRWLAKHGNRTIMCFVQFKGVGITDTPRVYLATPKEVAERLKQTKKGKGETILYENKTWTKRAYGYGTTDKVPDSWLISSQRLEELFEIIQSNNK